MDIRLRERRVTTVVLTGVLTDICVLHTAIDAYNLGYDIEVVESATASLTTEAHDFAIGHFKMFLSDNCRVRVGSYSFLIIPLYQLIKNMN